MQLFFNYQQTFLTTYVQVPHTGWFEDNNPLLVIGYTLSQ